MASQGKDVLVLCLDVGLGMQNSAPDLPTPLDQSLKILAMLIQRKIFAQSKDEIALVIFGCEETDHQLAQSDDDSYSNIKIAFPLGMPNFDLLKFVSNDIKPGVAETDFLDAIVVSLDILYKETRDRKINSRRVVLFTNFDHQSNDDNMEGIIAGFSAEDMDVELNIIGPTLHINDPTPATNNDSLSDDDQPGPSTSKRIKLEHKEPNKDMIDENTRKNKTRHQLLGENIMKRILESGVSGNCYSFSHADQAVTGFEKRSVRPAAWKCNLTLGKELEISCVAYAKTKEAKLKQSWKKCHAKTHKAEDITTNSYLYVDDEDRTEVEKETVGKGYKYGKDIIPYSADDEKQMKYTTEGKCLNILGFTHTDNVPVQLHMDDQAHYLLPNSGDQVASVALSALASGMQNQQLCAVACYVYRKGSNPKLVALIPHCKSDYKCFVMVSLPFSEDVRTLVFPSLPAKPSQEPSTEQLDYVDKLIDSMDLCGRGEELYKSKKMLNPFFQRTFQCLHHRSVNPNSPLPEPDTFISNILAPSEIIEERSAPHLNNIKKFFNLNKSPSLQKSTPTQRWKAPQNLNEDGDEKKIDQSSDATYQPLVTITTPTVERVGTVTPDSDFIAILSKCTNEDAASSLFNELQKVVEGLIIDPFVDQLQNKITVCLKVLISNAVQHNQVNAVNKFLLEIKSKLSVSNISLWNFLIQNDINLIGDSDYDGINRENFTSNNQKASLNIYQEDTEQDAEDLLAMME